MPAKGRVSSDWLKLAADKAFDITISGGLLDAPVISIDGAEVVNSLIVGSSDVDGNHSLLYGSKG